MWKEVKESEPNRDGTYFVAIGRLGAKQDTMMYTVDGGWNTYYESKGKLRGEGRDSEHYINNDGYVVAWFDLPDYIPA